MLSMSVFNSSISLLGTKSNIVFFPKYQRSKSFITHCGMLICISVLFSLTALSPWGTRKQASFFALSWLFVFGGSDLALLATCLAVQLFSLLSLSELNLPIPRTNLTGMSGHGVGNQCNAAARDISCCSNVETSCAAQSCSWPSAQVLSC